MKLSLYIILSLCINLSLVAQDKEGDYKAPKTKESIIIDAIGNEKSWSKAEWKSIKHAWLGTNPSSQDFEGRYKLLWDANYLYFLVEIKDDSLSDQHKSPTDLWWEDDCLELFIDENNSDGTHQFNHSAFAYHITLDLDVVDMSTKKEALLLNNHLVTKWVKTGKDSYVWEVAMRVYDDSYQETSQANKPILLKKGKKMGFAVSYNDNDGNFVRENFIGSVPIEGEDKNRGWIDAGVFGTVELVK